LRQGAVLYLNDQYGRSIRQSFVDEFTRLDGKLISIDPYLGSAPEIGPYLDLMVMRGRPDFLLIAGQRQDAELIIREARRRGLTMPILGGNGLTGIEQAGAIAEGVLYSSAYFPLPTTVANRTFLASYARRFPEQPTPSQTAAATYDAVYLLSEAIARAGSERRAVHAALTAVGSAAEPFDGVTGTIAFDENGDLAHRQMHVGVIRQGAITIPGGR
jgi:branched-chain amino acid transport system substrate-binding protein